MAIRHLKSLNNFDEMAFSKIASDIKLKRFLLLVIFVSCILLAKISPKEDISYLFFGLGICFLFLSVLSPLMLNKFILPYAAGEVLNAKIVSASYDPVPTHGYSGWSIKYQFNYNGKVYYGTHVGMKTNDLGSKDVSVGDEIRVLYMPSSPNRNAPYIEEKFKEYSIRKEL